MFFLLVPLLPTALSGGASSAAHRANANVRSVTTSWASTYPSSPIDTHHLTMTAPIPGLKRPVVARVSTGSRREKFKRDVMASREAWMGISRQWPGTRRRLIMGEKESLSPEDWRKRWPRSPPSRISRALVPAGATAAASPGLEGEQKKGGIWGRIGGFFKELIIHDDDDHGHDHAPVVHESDEAKAQSARRVVWLGIYGDILLTAVKAGVGFVARSPALLADSLHSLADIVGHFVTLICVQLARRPSNEIFPYGFGKFETAGSLLVAFLMIFAGFELIHQSVGIIAASSSIEPASGPLLFAAGGTAAAAVVIKEILFQLTAREGRRQGSPMLETTAWHHRSDAMSSATALVGIAGTIMGVRWADPLAGTIVAGIVLSIGLQIAWKSIKELMDMSVPPETLERLEALVQEASDRGFESLDADSNGRISREEWVSKYGSEEGFSSYDTDGNGYIDIGEWNNNRLKVVSVRARKMGPHLMLDVDMDVPSGARFAEIQKAQDKMLKHIHSSNPRVREIRFQLTTTRSTSKGSTSESSPATGKAASENGGDIHSAASASPSSPPHYASN